MKHPFSTIFFELTRVIHRHSFKIQKRIPINLHEFWILMLLLEGDSLSIRQIQRELQLAHNTVSELVQRLEKLKLVKKMTDSRDRRVRRIQITSDGVRLVEQLKDRILELGDQIISHIPEEQQELVIQAFQILLQVLQKEMG
jgi:DNA-binding MarR family transcriptional regulator